MLISISGKMKPNSEITSDTLPRNHTFRFGENWKQFSSRALCTDRVDEARQSFLALMDGIPLANARFLDVGFGQGLALFFASEAGATVIGIDPDPENLEAVGFTSRFFPNIPKPTCLIESILNEVFVGENEQTFDVVHAWGSLHHTGDMGVAWKNCCKCLKAENSYLVVSIYNRHWTSSIWKRIKYLYNIVPNLLQRILVLAFCPVIMTAKFIVTRQNPLRKERGMEFYTDVIDWLGGYPYEYASPSEVQALGLKYGLRLLWFSAAQVPTGCNEYVFAKGGEGKVLGQLI